MSKVLVSFATRPGRGSEGGAGWAFVRAAANYAALHEQRVHIVIDQRDEVEVRAALSAMRRENLAIIHSVSLPTWAIHRWGDSRTRASYLTWLPRARRAVRKIVAAEPVDVIHQATFATATLPSALPRTGAAKRIWGPLSVPAGVVHAEQARPSMLGQFAVHIAEGIARLHVRRADVVIATNEGTFASISGIGREALLEPNIAVDGLPVTEPHDEHLLSIVGLLIERKRPWIAVEVLSLADLGDYHLQIIGDGPLRGSLEKLVMARGLTSRVHFLGNLRHEEALIALGRSRLLLHPAVREGSPWAVGGAAALGVPAVVFDGVGAATTVRLSHNGGQVVSPSGDLVSAFAAGVASCLRRETPAPLSRWSSERFTQFLDVWWGTNLLAMCAEVDFFFFAMQPGERRCGVEL